MITWFPQPINITPGSTATWVDVSGQVPAGAKGVVVVFESSANANPPGDKDIGLRCNGSTDTLLSKGYWNATPDPPGGTQEWVMCGVDANGVFEVYVEDTSLETVWLLGYFGQFAPVRFFTNFVDISPTADATWRTVGIAAYTGVDTAVAALIHHYQPDGNYEEIGVRRSGYTGTETSQGHWFNTTVIALNASEQFECLRATGATAVKCYLAGYFTADYDTKDTIGPWIESMTAQAWKGNPLCDKPGSATEEYTAAICFNWYGVTANTAGQRHPLWQSWDVHRKLSKDGAHWTLMPIGPARKPETWQYDPPNQYGFIHGYLKQTITEPDTKAIPSYVKQDNAVNTVTSASETEISALTIAWATLTGAGFAAGDDVILIVKCCVGGSDTATVSGKFRVAHGTSFAGRTTWGDSLGAHKPISATSGIGHTYVWLKKHQLVTNENIYFSGQSVGAATCRIDDFCCWILSLSALGENDWRYAETTHAGDAATSYSDGAGMTLPAWPVGSASSWLLIGATHWLIDSTTASVLQKLVVAGADKCEVQYQGADTAEEYSIGSCALAKGIATTTAIKTAYKSDTAATQDCTRTALFALRLDAFACVTYDDNPNTISQAVVDTYYDEVTAGFHQKAAAAQNVIMLAAAQITTGDVAKQSYGRLRADGADFPSASWDRTSYANNGTADKKCPIWMAQAASVTQGHKDYSLQLAEDNDITPAPAATYGVLVALVPEKLLRTYPNTAPKRWREVVARN